MSLREKMLEDEIEKEEIEVDGETLKVSGPTLAEVEALQENIENPNISDLEALLTLILRHLYDEDGETKAFDEDSVDEIMDQEGILDLIFELIEEYCEAVGLDADVDMDMGDEG